MLDRDMLIIILDVSRKALEWCIDDGGTLSWGVEVPGKLVVRRNLAEFTDLDDKRWQL